MSTLLEALARATSAAGGQVEAEPYDERDPRAASLAGRRAASRALRAFDRPTLGLDDRFDDGRPRWPRGVTGSITHAAGWAVVVLLDPDRPSAVEGGARSRCIGVDLERDGALSPDDAAFVLTARESDEVLASGDPASTATVLWGAKEAAFKAWSELVDGALPTVHPERDLDVWLDVASSEVRVEACAGLRDALAAGPHAPPVELRGRVWRAAGLVLCALGDGSVC